MKFRLLVFALSLIIFLDETSAKPKAVFSPHQASLIDHSLTFTAKIVDADQPLYRVYWAENYVIRNDSGWPLRNPITHVVDLKKENDFVSEWTLYFSSREFSPRNYSVKANIVLPRPNTFFGGKMIATEVLPFTLATELPVTESSFEKCDESVEYVAVDCHTYYSCVNFEQKRYFRCSKELGLAFNPELRVCDRIWNVNGCQPAQNCTSEYRGHPKSCSQYYFCPDVCNEDLCEVRTCPGDLHWNVDADGNGHQQCTLPQFAKCLL